MKIRRFPFRSATRPTLALFFLAAAGGSAQGPPPGWAPQSEREHLDGAVLETVWETRRPPGGPHDRIRLHRYAAPGGPEPLSALFYLPGTNMNGTTAATEARHSLFLWLPQQGIPVYALSYRTHTLGSRDLDDPSVLSAWSTSAFTLDAAAALDAAAHDSGRAELFVAGFSRGVTLAYTTASRALPTGATSRVAGLILLDGSFKRAVAAGDTADPDAALRTLRASGNFASDVAAGIGWRLRDRLLRGAADDPGGAVIEGPFDDKASLGEQVATLLYTAWGPGRLASPIEAHVEGLTRVDVLSRLLAGYDRYYPTVQNPDGAALAAQADAPSPLDDRWGELTIPILNFTASGMGNTWVLDSIYSAVESGSDDVTPILLEGFGHLDVLVSERSEEEVFEVVRRWIAARADRRQ